jgi:hypothetical protein
MSRNSRDIPRPTRGLALQRFPMCTAKAALMHFDIQISLTSMNFARRLHRSSTSAIVHFGYVMYSVRLRRLLCQVTVSISLLVNLIYNRWNNRIGNPKSEGVDMISRDRFARRGSLLDDHIVHAVRRRRLNSQLPFRRSWREVKVEIEDSVER